MLCFVAGLNFVVFPQVPPGSPGSPGSPRVPPVSFLLVFYFVLLDFVLHGNFILHVSSYIFVLVFIVCLF